MVRAQQGQDLSPLAHSLHWAAQAESHNTEHRPALLSNNPLSFHEWEAEQVVCCPDAVANQKACMGQSANHTDQNKICTEQKGPFSSFRFAAYCLFTCDVICRICPGLTFQPHYLVISMQFESAGDKNKIVHFRLFWIFHSLKNISLFFYESLVSSSSLTWFTEAWRLTYKIWIFYFLNIFVRNPTSLSTNLISINIQYPFQGLSWKPLDDGGDCRGSGWIGKVSSATGDVKMTRDWTIEDKTRF